MNIFVFIAASLVGWCPLPQPKPKPPIPKEPLFGIIGGIAGAFVVYYALGAPSSLPGMDLVAMLFGAFATGKVFQDLAGRFGPSGQS